MGCSLLVAEEEDEGVVLEKIGMESQPAAADTHLKRHNTSSSNNNNTTSISLISPTPCQPLMPLTTTASQPSISLSSAPRRQLLLRCCNG